MSLPPPNMHTVNRFDYAIEALDQTIALCKSTRTRINDQDFMPSQKAMGAIHTCVKELEACRNAMLGYKHEAERNAT